LPKSGGGEEVGVEELNLDKGAGLNDCPKPKEEKMEGSKWLQPK